MVGVCRSLPLDIGNLVSEYDAARPEPTVPSVVIAAEVQDFCRE